MRAGGVQQPSTLSMLAGAGAKLLSLIKKRRKKKESSGPSEARKEDSREQPKPNSEGEAKREDRPKQDEAGPLISQWTKGKANATPPPPPPESRTENKQREFERLGGIQRLPTKNEQPSMAETWRKKKGSHFSELELQHLSEDLGLHISQVRNLVGAGKPKEQREDNQPPPDRTEKEEIASLVQAQGDPSKTSQAADAAQLGLDAAGVVDPTPIADGSNAAISIGRMFTDRKRWKTHATNAAISTVSMVPYAGDFAKVLKARHAAKVAKRAGKATPPQQSFLTRLKNKFLPQAEVGPDGIRSVPRVTPPPIEKNPIGASPNKREQRDNLRTKAHRYASAMFGSDDKEVQQAGEESQPGGPTVRPRDSKGRFVSGGSGSGNPPPSATEETKGVAAVDKWKSRLDKAGERVMKFAGPVGKAAVASVAFLKGLSLLNTGVLALNRDLARYSGGVATAYAKSDAADVQRKFRKGEALAGPLQDLAAEQAELKDTLQKMTLPVEGILLKVLVKVTELSNDIADFVGIIRKLNPGIDGALKTLEKLGEGEAEDKRGFQKFFEDAADGKLDGRAPTFGRHSIQILKDDDHRDVFG